MAFWKGLVEGIAGGVLIAEGVLITGMTFGGAGAIGALLISAGSGLVLTGIGTMLTRGPLQGFATAQKNPTAPWNGVYGRARVGGTLIYDNSFGEVDKWRDMVFVLACHSCESVDELLFDQQRVQIGSPGVSEGPLGSNAWSGTSFSPVQKDPSISDITRVGNVVTVHLSNDIPLLSDGDQIIIQNVHPVNAGLNGKFPVTVISHGPGDVMVFSYLSGGTAISIPAYGGSETGDAHTAWVDYGRKVYMEVMLGRQTLGETFQGMLYGTPEDGDGGVLALTPGGSTINPWTANCSLVGKTCVWLRLHYNDTIFANGLPQISFHIHGKNDILLNPGGSPPSYGYTENAALCIADYLSNSTFGFGAVYGVDIPTAPLVAAAAICDEAVALAEGGTEPRYTCNGGWVLTTKRGEVLKNLLTSCAGRLTDYGGQFVVWPGAYGLAEVYAGRTTRNLVSGDWETPAPVSESVTGTSIYSLLTGGFRWKPKVSITELYNGVKGTFIAPVNNWQSTDFPPYAQDIIHGYVSDANQAADGGDRRWYDIQLPFTISCPTAQRLAKIELMRRRQQGTGTFALNMAAYQFTPMDVIALDLSYFAWTAKALEIAAARLKIAKQQEVPLLGVEIDVQETDSSVYAWSIGEELSPAGYQQAVTPSTMTPAPPTNFLLSSISGDIIATWTAPADGYVLNGGDIEIRYQLVASPEGLWLSLAKMDPSVTQASITNLAAGDQYTVEIRSVNAGGIPSAWVIGGPYASPPSPGPITVASPPIWQPNYETPVTGDPLFSAEGFGVAQSYAVAGDGSALAAVNVYGYPPPAPFGLTFKVRRELVSGDFAQVAANVVTVDATHGKISFGAVSPPTSTTNEFIGRIISKLANAAGILGSPIPIQDFTVTANNTGGDFTVTPDPTTAGCGPGDLFTLRTGGPGAGSPPSVANPLTADATSFTDSRFFNDYNPGLTVNGNRGNLALVIGGHGAFQTPQTVVSNTGSKVNVSPGWDVIPDSTSIIVLVEAVPQVVLAADLTAVSDALIGNVPIDNYSRQVVRVEGYASYAGQTGPIETVPFREIYEWGGAGNFFKGGIQFSVNGTLGIGSDQAPHVFTSNPVVAVAVRFVVKTAPTGADLTFNLVLGGALWMTLTIPAGTTSVAATTGQIVAAAPIPANTAIALDITAVGTTFPGSGLSGAVFF